MAGISIDSRIGPKIKSKRGTYFIEEKIEQKENGIVYNTAKLINGGEELPFR
ncbi:MAG: hypothetical protein E7A50_04670 [Clostridiales bacterium]|nr:hypothetical protein [Clostridiales bacterium]MDU1028768.1 hypothetical protein [Clostridiales bacterium]